LVAAGVVGALIAGGGFALASGSNKTIHGCVSKSTHVLSVQRRCPSGSRALVWNQQGPTGLQGPRGLTGATGATGAAGTVPWTIDFGQILESSGINSCGISQGRGLSACNYLGVGYYQVTATGCDSAGAPSAPSNIQLTPDATAQIGSNQGNPTFVVHAEVDGYASGPSNQLTFGIRVLGWSGGSATPAPVDAPVYVLVNC
jgi:hypothetical protein